LQPHLSRSVASNESPYTLTLNQIRTIYRTVEFSLGIDGYPFQHEWPLFVLEALPMFIALGTMAWYHPVRWLQKSGHTRTRSKV
jgi:hypothetical protein